jgi:hypothetical protein
VSKKYRPDNAAHSQPSPWMLISFETKTNVLMADWIHDNLFPKQYVELMTRHLIYTK